MEITEQDFDIYARCQYDTCTVCDYYRRAICREITTTIRERQKKLISGIKKTKKGEGE